MLGYPPTPPPPLGNKVSLGQHSPSMRLVPPRTQNKQGKGGGGVGATLLHAPPPPPVTGSRPSQPERQTDYAIAPLVGG